MGGLLQTKQTWRMSDSENGSEDETVLEDHAEYTAPLVLAMLVKRKASAAHVVRNKDIRHYNPSKTFLARDWSKHVT